MVQLQALLLDYFVKAICLVDNGFLWQESCFFSRGFEKGLATATTVMLLPGAAVRPVTESSRTRHLQARDYLIKPLGFHLEELQESAKSQKLSSLVNGAQCQE